VGASAECEKGCDLVIDGARPSARRQVLTGVPVAMVDTAKGTPDRRRKRGETWWWARGPAKGLGSTYMPRWRRIREGLETRQLRGDDVAGPKRTGRSGPGQGKVKGVGANEAGGVLSARFGRVEGVGGVSARVKGPNTSPDSGRGVSGGGGKKPSRE